MAREGRKEEKRNGRNLRGIKSRASTTQHAPGCRAGFGQTSSSFRSSSFSRYFSREEGERRRRRKATRDRIAFTPEERGRLMLKKRERDKEEEVYELLSSSFPSPLFSTSASTLELSLFLFSLLLLLSGAAKR